MRWEFGNSDTTLGNTECLTYVCSFFFFCILLNQTSTDMMNAAREGVCCRRNQYICIGITMTIFVLIERRAWQMCAVHDYENPIGMRGWI